MKFLRTTKTHSKYWKDRKIDWKKDYFDTWNHPHRYFLTAILKSFNWFSLLEVGCGGGANLANILMVFKDRQLGGIDINPEAIEVCEQQIKGGFFKTGGIDNILMSDSSTDVILSDMTYIYVGPLSINKYIKELKRVTRKWVMLCEFNSESLWERIKIRWNSGYNAYDWKKLLKKHGFYDIKVYRLPPEAWPGAGKDNPRRVILAKIIK